MRELLDCYAKSYEASGSEGARRIPSCKHRTMKDLALTVAVAAGLCLLWCIQIVRAAVEAWKRKDE